MNAKFIQPAKQVKIDLPVFSGPLDLLLHLIDRQELEITAVSLAQVCQQYLEQVERFQQEKIEHLMDFIVIGARLLLIKSRALLPKTPVTLFDEDEEEDPAEALARQLRRYKQFKEAAGWLGRREELGLRAYLRIAPPPKLEPRLDMSGITVANLTAALRAALARTDQLAESVSVARRRVITVDRQIQRLRGVLKQQERVQFRELLSAQPDRIEISVTLLAVLELIKQREINAYQPYLFGPIEIAANGAY